jgi:hypothetical protein
VKYSARVSGTAFEVARRMRAAGVVVVSLVLVIAAGARVARAQPGMTPPTPAGTGPSTTPAAPSPVTSPGLTPAVAETTTPEEPHTGFALGVDIHLGFGGLIESDISARGELQLSPHFALVGRAGIGSYEWMDMEYDDPTYSQVFGRVGVRASSKHIYAGVEIGRVSVKAHWDAIDDMPAHDGERFGGTTYTALVGWKLGPVDLGFDYTAPFSAIGFYVGGGYRRR